MSTVSARLQGAISPLLDKMTNSDPDFRFMALDDLMKVTARDNLSNLDEAFEKKMVNSIVTLVKDNNSEVKSKAANCLGFLVRSVREPRMQDIMDKLVEFISTNDPSLRDVASLGLKIVVGEIPAETPLASSACHKLTPKLIAVLQDSSSSPELLMDSVDILADIFTRFSGTISKNLSIQKQSLDALTKMLGHGRMAVKKRSLVAVGALGACSTSDIFTQLSKQMSAELSTSNPERISVTVQLIGLLSKTCPRRLGRRLPEFMPRMISLAENSKEDDGIDIVENCLTTIGSILERCRAESGQFVVQSVELGTRFIMYDPNYAEEIEEDQNGMDVDSDDKMEEDGADEEEDDDDEQEDYSDDEDLSWKIRRSSSKLLASAIQSRPELLGQFSQSIAPVLVKRFGEREESVRIENLNTFFTFLKKCENYLRNDGEIMTEVVGAGGAGVLKRKRSDMEIDVKKEEADGPIAQTRSLVPLISKALSKELSSKSVATLIPSISVLRELVVVLRGSLDSYLSALTSAIAKSLKTSDSSSGPGSNLKAEALIFFKTVFQNHSSQAFSKDLSKLVPILTVSMGDKMHRNSIEGFSASEELVKTLRPLGNGASRNDAFKPHLLEIYQETISRLTRSDSDSEIREASISCLGTLLSHCGDEIQDKFSECLPLLADRLKSEVTRLASLKVLTQTCSSSVCSGPEFDSFLKVSISEVSNLLRQNNRAVKFSSFVCLIALLKRLGNNLDSEIYTHVLSELGPLLKVSEIDQNLFPMKLQIIGLILASSTASQQEIKELVLPNIYDTLSTSLIAGRSLEALLEFFRGLISIDSSLTSNLVENLMKSLARSRLASQGSNLSANQISSTIAKCIGAILISSDDHSSVQTILKQRQATLEAKKANDTEIYFALLLLGEVGRFTTDFSTNTKLWNKIMSFYKSDSEEIKSAVSFSVGNIAVGNLDLVLPILASHITTISDSEVAKKEKFLSLNALKELITHGSSSQLETLAPQLFGPLFNVASDDDEALRNIASECLARLILTDPTKYLSELQSRLVNASGASNSKTRAAVISAVRFTLTDTSTSYDEALKPVIMDFLACLNDDDIEVRKNAMLIFNSSGHNKPNLIRDHLEVLLPMLYKETKRNDQLIRKVPMGPFTVTIDDGLDLRKSAFETMYTLLDTCLAKIDVPEYMKHITVGLTDDDSIRVLCYLTLMRLADLAPLPVSQHLEEIVDPTNAKLKEMDKEKEKNKDTKTKQEIEKSGQLTRSIYRALVALQRLPSSGMAPKFTALVADIRKGDQGRIFQDVEAQVSSNPMRGKNVNGEV